MEDDQGADEQLIVAGKISGDCLMLSGARVLNGPREGRNLTLHADMRFGQRTVDIPRQGKRVYFMTSGVIELDGATYSDATLRTESPLSLVGGIIQTTR